MKNLKENKGITLVALIITIIVLMILAIVTIAAVNEGSLFLHANNAATAYDRAAGTENAIVSNYISEIGKHVVNNSDSNSNSNPNTQSEVNVGDLIGTYYPNNEIGNNSSEGLITFTETKVYYMGLEGTYTLDTSTLVITAQLDYYGEILEMEFGFDPNGFLTDSVSRVIKLIKSDAQNVSYSLLDGMRFQKENSSTILEFANGTVTEGTKNGTYFVYNGQVYGITDVGVDIIYEGDKIVSIQFYKDGGNSLIKYDLVEE